MCAAEPLACPIDRRTFVGILLGLVVGARETAASQSSVTSAVNIKADREMDKLASTGPDMPPLDANVRLLDTLSDPAAARQLGQRYLDEHPQEQDTNRLVDQLWAALQTQRGEIPTDSPALQQALVRLVQQEYVSAPMQSVDGWLLTPSEARLYALAALSTRDPQLLSPADRPRPLSTARC